MTKHMGQNKLSETTLRRCMQNRETSWLKFNERVLEEAANPQTPLFERLFYLSVFTTNLDEFFMVRVGGFQDLAASDAHFVDNKTGMDAAEVLKQMLAATATLYPLRDQTFAVLEAELARENIPRHQPSDLDEAEQTELLHYYLDWVEPLLAPQIVDKTHPFPHIENKRLVVAVFLEDRHNGTFGMIPLPRKTDRLYRTKDGGYILLEDILLHFASRVFKKQTIIESTVVCVTRNADIDTLDEPFEADEDFRDHMSRLLKRKNRLAAVRLELVGDQNHKLTAFLKKKLSLHGAQIFSSTAPLDLDFYSIIREQATPEQRARLSFTPFEPHDMLKAANGKTAGNQTSTNQSLGNQAAVNQSMIQRIQQGDMLISLPYDSLNPFLALVREAAEDERVLSIQITLYRLADRSRLAETLIEAAARGKDVSVFIELRARMDEENNISWANRLEDAGCSVFYGQLGYKTHAKICLITLREDGRNQLITQIATGNYNEKTARTYTDLSLMTVDPRLTQDAVRFFHNLRTDAINDTYPFFWVAPHEFKPKLIEHIGMQAALGAEGYIAIKCNSISDQDVIKALVEASMAGVEIDLIIRGICCLVPGIPGLTENISVRSIVGRFLEHSRVYRFGRGTDADLYIGSADMMTRNTKRRIELFTPLWNPALRSRLFEMLDIELHDNIKARILTAEGLYVAPQRATDEPELNSQDFFMQQSLKATEALASAQSLKATDTSASAAPSQPLAKEGRPAATSVVGQRPATGLIARARRFIQRLRKRS
ncbi:MAG: polyphosphate kinase 1 [Coriobacteriales bacterium]|nr:polyphosphate kinase 1 [Coriobacteriales bacterium]